MAAIWATFFRMGRRRPASAIASTRCRYRSRNRDGRCRISSSGAHRRALPIRANQFDGAMGSLILVMVCAIAAGWLANRVRVPYPIVLVLAGIGLGIRVRLAGTRSRAEARARDRAAGGAVPGRHRHLVARFPANLRSILLLAIGLVATTTLAVGVAFKWLVPGRALGGRVRARRDRLAAGRGGGDGGAAAVPAAAPDRDAARGREPRERRDRPRALPVRRGRGADRRVFRLGARRRSSG